MLVILTGVTITADKGKETLLLAADKTSKLLST